MVKFGTKVFRQTIGVFAAVQLITFCSPSLLCHVLEVLKQMLSILRSHFHLFDYTFKVRIEGLRSGSVVASLDPSSPHRAISDCMR